MSQYPEVEIHIMRTAAELWELAGPDMWLYRWSEDGHALLQGKASDRCAMEAGEFADYQRMRTAWRRAGQDLAGAPSISMREVTADEDVDPFADDAESGLSREDLGRIYASLGSELRQIRELVRSAQTTISIDDYGDALAGAFDRLGTCIKCVSDLEAKPSAVPCAAECPMPNTCRSIGCVGDELDAQSEGGAA